MQAKPLQATFLNQMAEVLKLKLMEGKSINAIHHSTGLSRKKVRKLLGIVVKEFWPLPDNEPCSVVLGEQRYTCEHWRDWIELEGAEVVGTFADGWLEGRAAVTRNAGAWYVGTRPDPGATAELVRRLATEANVAPTVAAPPGVEAVRRSADGRSLLFLLNHGSQEVSVEIDGEQLDLLSGAKRSGRVVLDPFGVAVLTS